MCRTLRDNGNKSFDMHGGHVASFSSLKRVDYIWKMCGPSLPIIETNNGHKENLGSLTQNPPSPCQPALSVVWKKYFGWYFDKLILSEVIPLLISFYVSSGVAPGFVRRGSSSPTAGQKLKAQTTVPGFWKGSKGEICSARFARWTFGGSLRETLKFGEIMQEQYCFFVEGNLKNMVFSK